MSTYDTSTQKRLVAEPRPDNCTCKPRDGLPCWPCYRAGLEFANPAGTGRSD